MPAQKIRILCEAKEPSSLINDQNSGESPFWWRGSDLEIEIALSQDGRMIDPAEVGSIYVAVKDADALSTDGPRMIKTLTPADVDLTFSPAGWQSKTQQLATASFTAAEAALAAGDYRLIVFHVDSNGASNTHLYADVKVEEDQHDNLTLIPPLPLEINDQVIALIAAIEENGDLVDAANTGATEAVNAAAAAVKTLDEIGITAFPTASIIQAGSFAHSGVLTVNLTGGQSFTLHEAVGPYTEDNSFFVGVSTWDDILRDLVPLINGDVQDQDTSIDYGTAEIGIWNYVPFENLYAEIVDDGGDVLELTYFAEAEETLSLPAPLVVTKNGTFSAAAGNPFLLKSIVQTLTPTEISNVKTSLEIGSSTSIFPDFPLDPSDDLNATATTAAIQAALDSGSRVQIPNGYYKLNGTLTQNTRGQTIEGESATATILEWIVDVDGIVIGDHTSTDPVDNGPGSAGAQNAVVTLENLWTIGIGSGCTSSGIAIGPNTINASDWNGPRTTIRNVNANGWGVGFDIQYSSKVELSNTLAKSCQTYGYQFNSATNNCQRGERISAEDCPVGVYINATRGGYFALGDFSNCDRGVHMLGGNATFIGGELESFDSEFFYLDGAIATIITPRFLSGENHPIRITNASGLHLIGPFRDTPKASFEEMIIVEDAASVITGPAIGSFLSGTRTAAAHDDYRVKAYVSSGVYQKRAFGPVPWVNGSTTAPDLSYTGLIELAQPKASTRGGSQMIVTMEDGDSNPYRHYLTDQNHKTKIITGTNYAPAGWENLIKFTNTSPKNCNLPATTSTNMRAAAENAKSFLVYNNAATGDLSVNPNGAETINGVAATVTVSPRGSLELFTNGDGDWLGR